ncbi:MAG: zf-HC2 domain-containing protein [Thermodesulfobacteriota bacterium]
MRINWAAGEVIGVKSSMEVICKDIVDNIIEYIDMELDRETLVALETHMGDCPECQAFVDTYKKMLQISGKLKEKTFVTPEIRRRLKEFLKTRLSD